MSAQFVGQGLDAHKIQDQFSDIPFASSYKHLQISIKRTGNVHCFLRKYMYLICSSNTKIFQFGVYLPTKRSAQFVGHGLGAYKI